MGNYEENNRCDKCSAWQFARIDGRKKYCGKGSKGQKMAIAAKSKDIAKKYENREIKAGLKTKRSEFKTVTDIVNWFMSLPINQEKRVYRRDICKAANVLAYFGKKPIDAIEPEAQTRYRQYRLKQGVVSGTIDLEIGFWSKVYHLAVRWKKIPKEILPGEFVLDGKYTPRRCITEDEYHAILENTNPNFKDFLICAWETGMRVSEICNLTVGKVHMGEMHISVQSLDYISLGIFDTKTQTPRNIPVSPALKEVLKRRLEGLSDGDYVFTNRFDRPFNKNVVGGVLKCACGHAGVIFGDKPRDKDGNRTGITFHCFRHTRITKWVEAGYSDEVIRMATGHKSIESYRKYVHLDASAVMRLVSPSEPKTVQKRNISNVGHSSTLVN